MNAVIADDATEMMFVLWAMFSKGARRMNSLARITKNGVPGGCGLPRIFAAAMNSPQSQKERVAAIVLKKTANGIIKLSAPNTIEMILTTLLLLSSREISHLLILFSQADKIATTDHFVKL